MILNHPFQGLLRAFTAGAALALAAAPPSTMSHLAQSVPVETGLADPSIPFAKDVWVDMIRGARRTLDFGEFYVTNRPHSALEPVLGALEAAGARGVKIRFLLSAKMLGQDPASVARLKAIPGAEVRSFDLTGVSHGILHAKYFLADGREAYFGSQNFDWRALEEIHELGVRTTDARLVDPLREIFEMDWHFAATHRLPDLPKPSAPLSGRPEAELVASPPFLTPGNIRPSLGALVELLGQAKQRIRVQLLTYSPVAGQDRFWPALDNALRAAAVRGVHVQLLVSDWVLGGRALPHLKSLSLIPNLEVRIASIPEASEGHIPYARTIHSKYLVVDDGVLWLGTSNWEEGYFTDSRNVEAIFRDPAMAAQGTAIFDRLWNSRFAFPLDPTKAYDKRKVD